LELLFYDLVALFAHYNVKVKLFADDVTLYVNIVTQSLVCVVCWASELQFGCVSVG